MSYLASSLDRPPDAAEERARAAHFLGEALREIARGARGDARWFAITLPAPVAPLEALACAGAPAILWDPPAGPRFAGVGAAIELTAAGPERIAHLPCQAAALWPRIATLACPGVAPEPPRLFGGFAFAPGAAAAPPWSAFGDARFVLPAWLYRRDPEHATLSLVVDSATLCEPGAPDLDAWHGQHMAELDRMLAVLAGDRPDAATARDARAGDGAVSATLAEAVTELDPAAWRRQIADIRAAIEARQCDKIVAARCTRVALSRAVSPAEVLGVLERRYADCYRFGFSFAPDAMFVGATPERLIARAGDRVLTEALAGSIAAGPGDDRSAAAALLASRKDRSEQDFVVRAIVAALGPLCSRLDVPAEPEIRVLRHVLHLKTSIQGALRQPVHVLELVAALHPTPAVGGVPTARAMAWIAEREPAPRGWYAAPVGWFDAGGQGEFAVAIRSGLLAGNEAYLYAGAGIVRDSDPDAEFAETRLKQRAVLDALVGVTG